MKSDRHHEAFLKEFGAHLRKVRQSKSLTMEAVAYEAEIEYRQLGRIERGEINTTLITLLRITNALEIDFADLFVSFKKKGQ